MSEHQLNTHGPAAPQPLARTGGFFAGAARGGLGHPANPLHQAPATSSAPGAVAAGQLAGVAKQSRGAVSHVAPALEAAARGESLAQQAARVTGPVRMSAANALRIAASMDPASSRQQIQGANSDPNGGYRSPFVSVGLSGITNDQGDAEHISSAISGGLPNQQAHGYAAYGRNSNTYQPTGSTNPGVNSDTAKSGGDTLDALTDVAAVTQYAAAAEMGIRLQPNARGDGRQVQIDWGALSNMTVEANLGPLGGKIRYDSPAAVAENGYQAVLADMATRRADPSDRNQFISLTGHSGGGQSSFYTALRLASEGYRNVSLVGVDMAMTPHEREVLQTLGVNVTNITSNSNVSDAGGRLGRQNSLVGEGIRTGMGGGQNFYDLNVRRQTDGSATDAHGITNDANVVATVRFAQYLDSIGAHGQYTPAQYQQFLADTNGRGNQAVLDPQSGAARSNRVVSADANLFAPGSTTVTDQRNLPGPSANNPAGGASWVETLVNGIGGRPVTQAIQSAGQSLHNRIDAVGDAAGSAISGGATQAGGFLGGLFRRGGELLGSGVSAVGNLLGNGASAVGNLAQSAMSGVSGAASFLGNAASSGLNALGRGASAAGNTIGNGLDRAGDAAQSWLGSIPLVGGLLGRAANAGLDLVGSGVSGVGNLLGNGASAVGNAAQWAGATVASGANAVGNLAHQGLDAVGSGLRGAGGLVGSGLSTLGGWGQQAITGASSAVGNVLGGAARTGIGLVGSGVDGAFDLAGRGAGALVEANTAPLVWLLQGVGLDTGQIGGLAGTNRVGFNPSQRWPGEIEQAYANGAPRRVQTLPAVDSPASAAPDPIHAHYAN